MTIRSIVQDVRYALRQFRKSPGFAIIVVAVLALGIGANIAVFTLLNGVLLRPLPYANADRLVSIELAGPMPYYTLTYANMLQLRDAVGPQLKIGAEIYEGSQSASIVGSGGRFQVTRSSVTSGLFDMLGVQPVLGRGFRAEENEPGKNHVQLLGDDVWRKVFNADPSIVGKTIHEAVEDSFGSQALIANLLETFAGLALLIASVGLYGLLSFAVAQRTREIGARLALGAPKDSILRLVLGRAVALVSTGLAAGGALAWFSTTFARGYIYGVQAHDGLTFAAVILVLAVASFLAAWLPARRAASVDPILALRSE